MKQKLIQLAITIVIIIITTLFISTLMDMESDGGGQRQPRGRDPVTAPKP